MSALLLKTYYSSSALKTYSSASLNCTPPSTGVVGPLRHVMTFQFSTGLLMLWTHHAAHASFQIISFLTGIGFCGLLVTKGLTAVSHGVAAFR